MKLFCIHILLLVYPALNYSQCRTQVTHTAGTLNVDGTQVSVSSAGFVIANDSFCYDTFPYGMGIIQTGNNGSFSFNFSPAISSLTLNIGGLSNVNGHVEEVTILKNGVHYPVPTIGDPHHCGLLASLTSSGNIIGCQGCLLSGWNETILNGPITSLRVMDTVISGDPNGAIFSLFICSNPLSVKKNSALNKAYQFLPNPFTGESILKTPSENNLSFMILDRSGKTIITLNPLAAEEIKIKKGDLTPGLYFYFLRNAETIISYGKLVCY